jgi:hypothetical protein
LESGKRELIKIGKGVKRREMDREEGQREDGDICEGWKKMAVKMQTIGKSERERERDERVKAMEERDWNVERATNWKDEKGWEKQQMKRLEKTRWGGVEWRGEERRAESGRRE